MASTIDPTKPADDVPAVKGELRANLQAAKTEIEALQAGKADAADAMLTRPELRDYRETSPTPEVVAGVLTLDLAAGNVVEVTLDQDVTTLVLADPPAVGQAATMTLILRQDASGGHGLAWPAAIKWPGGQAPALSPAAGAVDIYALLTRDGGATWYGFTGGQEFA